jgi:hypothetical protein
MPAAVVHSATVAHSAISAVQTGLLDGSTIGGQPSHRCHLQQHSLHHLCACIKPPPRIDLARRPLATEWLAIDGSIEAIRCDDGGSVFFSARTYPRFHRRLSS